MSEHNTQNKPSILVVDDSPQNLAIISQILKNEYSIKIANSGDKALSYLSSNKKPDLILLDIVMPVMDGYAFCNELKDTKEFRNIPIIFLTALEDDSEMIKGLQLGAVDFVIKPVSPHVLRTRVATHIKLKQFQDSLIETINEKDELLLEQSKMATLGEMLENIVHQWKQPINMISMASANMKIDMLFGEINKDSISLAIDGIDHSIEYLTKTMDDFRDFLHASSEAELCSTRVLIEQTLNLISSRIQDSGISLDVDVANDEIKIFRNDLIQIVMNIMNNSIDALEKISGEKIIKIRSKREQDNLKLFLCDNGKGIPENIIDKIFDKYFTTKIDNKGSGIGLYMCKILINKRIKGSIRAFNTTEGTCFEVILPLKDV